MKIIEKIRKNSYRGKMFILLAAGSTSIVLLVTFLWLGYGWHATKQTVERDLQTIALRSSAEMDQYLTGKIDTLMAVKKQFDNPATQRHDLNIMLESFNRKFTQFERMALYGSSNVLVASNDDNLTPLSDNILKIVLSGQTYRSPMFVKDGKLPFIRVALPIFRNGEVFRILLADINIINIWDKIGSIKIGETGRASILSSEGIFLADADKERVLNNVRWQDISEAGLPLDGKEGFLSASDRHGTSLDVAYAAIPSTGWTLLITQERSETMHFIYAMLLNALGIVILCIIAAYFASAALARKLSKPIEELHKGVEEMAKGNLKYEVPSLKGIEMEALGEHLNAMSMAIEEKEQTKEKLAELERLASIGRLADDMSHEINNPLAIITNYIFIAKRDTKMFDDPFVQSIELMNDEVDRISKMLNDFSNLYQGNSVRDDLQEIDPLIPLRSVLALCRLDMEDRGITVKEEIAEVGMVMADRDKFSQVFMNFMKNAMEAMPDGGLIKVKTLKRGEKVQISISDTGTGIHKDNLARLFDPFFTTKDVKNRGLGLSVSHGIIKSFGGNIEVESEAGKGASFTVTLPTYESAHKAVIIDAQAESQDKVFH